MTEVISHTSKVKLKTLQARLQQYMNLWELSDVQTGIRKAEESEIKLSTFTGSGRKQGNSRRTTISASSTLFKSLILWIITNSGKFFKRQEYQTTLPVSWETCIQVKKQQLEPDTEQTGSKLGKEYVKAVYCHLAYLTYVQSTSCQMPGWMNHKLESILLEKNINNLRYVDDTTIMAESEEELNSLLMKVKEESEKAGFKTQHSKN